MALVKSVGQGSLCLDADVEALPDGAKYKATSISGDGSLTGKLMPFRFQVSAYCVCWDANTGQSKGLFSLWGSFGLPCAKYNDCPVLLMMFALKGVSAIKCMVIGVAKQVFITTGVKPNKTYLVKRIRVTEYMWQGSRL